MVSVLLLLLACGSCGQPATPPPAAAPALKPRVVDPNLPAAPSTEILGLSIGKSTDAEIQAWIAERSLPCKTEPSPRRTTQRYTCDGDLSIKLLEGREIRGKFTSLLLVRGDTTPLSHLSTARKYSLPEDAAKDYSSSVALLSTRLGTPTRSAAVNPEKLSSPLMHYSSLWSFKDLEVALTMSRLGGQVVSVTERWDQPGVELAQGDRVQVLDRSKCKDPFCFDQPGMAPPGMKDPFGFDERAKKRREEEAKAAAEAAGVPAEGTSSAPPAEPPAPQK